MNTIDIYTDGSFNGSYASWAYIIVNEDKLIHSETGNFSPSDPINAGYQIGGELGAVMEGLKYCKKNRLKGRIFHDYIGIRSWVGDLFGEKPWKTNKFYTKEYRNFVLAHKEFLEDFVKVKGHSGNKWNEEVDKIAAKPVDNTKKKS